MLNKNFDFSKKIASKISIIKNYFKNKYNEYIYQTCPVTDVIIDRHRSISIDLENYLKSTVQH